MAANKILLNRAPVLIPWAAVVAMKPGGEYFSEHIAPANFERLAEEAGLAKPMMKRRVSELAEAVASKLPAVTTDHPVTAAIAKVIQRRCERKITSFKA
jgi:serine/threonine-protein kinase HipA